MFRRHGEHRIKKAKPQSAEVFYGHSAESTIGFLRCTGVELDDGSHVIANLVILAAGAWMPSVVDAEGRAIATLQLNEEEQKLLDYLPINFNVSRGMFVTPPYNKERLPNSQLKYQSISHSFGEGTTQCLHLCESAKLG
ncbi:hypothetical protein ACN38_g702 [Penicillium nordicum]|uniref:FAD dependent oxidoreductase domain-containing protein n=1 Tax=Penicillium nordicum TaxID=229535 RepID=A0A0M9WKG4_9EURO|nr:hypothetical protein ACN38_g702 [Penicillium nordicum]